MRYALDVRVRNAAIAAGMARHGCSQKGLADLAGVSYGTLNAWATLREGPWSADGCGLVPSAKKLATFLGETEADCFPPELYAHFVRRRSSRALIFGECNMLPLSEARLLADPQAGPEATIEREQTVQAVRAALLTLGPQEQQVIRMRFGIDDGHEHTLDEVGEGLLLSRSRISQIEARALRKLNHPSRGRKLEFLLRGSR